MCIQTNILTRMKALGDGGRVYEVSAANLASYVAV